MSLAGNVAIADEFGLAQLADPPAAPPPPAAAGTAGTVAENLHLVAPTATDEQLHAALCTVGAAQWVDALPDGLATRVGANGDRLPAGAHQQLTLARLVLADPAIVVLDEATADFDSAAAHALDHSLGAALAGRTVIAIAHRLHAAAAADRVAVLEDGRITETR